MWCWPRVVFITPQAAATPRPPGAGDGIGFASSPQLDLYPRTPYYEDDKFEVPSSYDPILSRNVTEGVFRCY
jgi:hypothetical protein